MSQKRECPRCKIEDAHFADAGSRYHYECDTCGGNGYIQKSDVSF